MTVLKHDLETQKSPTVLSFSLELKKIVLNPIYISRIVLSV